MASLNNSKEHELTTAKSTSTPYKMLKRMGGARSWSEIKKRLEVVYSPIATEVHAVSDLQEYFQNFTDFTEKAMGVDSANIMNRVIIFLFIKNLCSKDIRRRVASVKVINTLADAFRLVCHSLLN